MDSHDEEEAHTYYWDESISPFRVQMKEIGENSDGGFSPPYSIHQLPSHYRDDRHESLTQRAHYYARDIREIVLSFLNRFPLLDLTECLKSNWNLIAEEMEHVAPPIQAPRTNPEIWLGPLKMLELIIPIEDPEAEFLMRGVRPSDFWKDQELDQFKSILERIYGELPEGLRY